MQPVLKSSIDPTPFLGMLLALVLALVAAMPAAERIVRWDMPQGYPPYITPENRKLYEMPPWIVDLSAHGRIQLTSPKGLIVGDSLEDISEVVPSEVRLVVRPDPTSSYDDFLELVNGLQSRGYLQLAVINEAPSALPLEAAH